MYLYALPLLVHGIRDGKLRADPDKFAVFLPVSIILLGILYICIMYINFKFVKQYNFQVVLYVVYNIITI